MRRPINLFIRSATVLLSCQILLATMAAPAAADSTNASDADLRAHTLTLINQERAAQDLAPLVENPSLDAAAQSYADVLTNDSCFGHTCGSLPDFTQRDATAGYSPWTWLGENVAAGQPTPEEVVAAWMASPLHRANILRPEFTEAGIGIAHGGTHGTYWAQEFGTRPVLADTDSST